MHSIRFPSFHFARRAVAWQASLPAGAVRTTNVAKCSGRPALSCLGAREPLLSPRISWQSRNMLSSSLRSFASTSGDDASKPTVSSSSSKSSDSAAAAAAAEATASNVEKPADAGKNADAAEMERKQYLEQFSLSKTPPFAKMLGYAGLLPFFGTSCVILTTSSVQLAEQMALIQVQYGACILSFLGAVHWGLEMAEYGTQQYTQRMKSEGVENPSQRLDNFNFYMQPVSATSDRFAISVIPSLIGFATLLFPEVSPAMSVQLLTFGFLMTYDLRTVKSGLSPSWYTGLRFWLTLFVALNIAASVLTIDYIQMKKKKKNKNTSSQQPALASTPAN